MSDSSTLEHLSLIENTARRFLQDNYTFADHRKLIAEEPGYSVNQWQEMADLGWMQLPIDAEFGGLGGNMAWVAALAKEFGRALAVGPYLPSAVISAKIIQRATGHCNQAQLLRDMGSGDVIVSPALYEPRSRYCLEKIAVTAVRQNGVIVLNGTKAAVLYAQSADYFVVLAQSADPTTTLPVYWLYLVPSDLDGIKLTHYRMHDGGRMAELNLHNVEISESHVMLSGPKAFEAVEYALCCANASICAELVGAMEATLSITLEYVKSRTQFGRALSAFQSLQHRLVDMFMRVQLAESMSREAVRATELNDRVEREMMSSAAKCEISRAALLNAEEAIQLHGAMGMMDEIPAGHFLKRIFTLSMLFGDADYHQAHYRSLRLQADG